MTAFVYYDAVGEVQPVGRVERSHERAVWGEDEYFLVLVCDVGDV